MRVQRRLSRCRGRPGFETLEARQMLAVEHVVHVSVDGLSSQWLEPILQAESVVPTGQYAAFLQLRAEGSSTFNARTDFTHTNTMPNHTSMLTGRPVLAPIGQPVTLPHLWTVNTDPAVGATLHNNHSALNYVPSVFDVVHDRGLSTALYASKSKFSLFDVSYDAVNGALDEDPSGGDNGRDKIDTYVSRANTQALVDQFIGDLGERLYSYSFLHLADPDNAGHQFGWGSDTWTAAVKLAGRQIGRILDTIADHPMLQGRTAVIVTSDHGGMGHSHWESTQAANYRVPFFVWGPGIAARSDLYASFADRVADPGLGRPDYSAANQPVRNGDSGNLALDLMDLPPIEGSTINRLHSCSNSAGGGCTSPPPGAVELFDFGDAPVPFPTSVAANGALHRIEPGFHLGNLVDADADGLADALAMGDDLANDDEDGVVLKSELIPGQLARLDVAASAEGILQAWFDWNADGDWNDASELAIHNQPLVAGANEVSLQVPPEARTGTTIARFRFSRQIDLPPTGLATAGEVEDYQFRISNVVHVGQLDARDDNFMIRPGGSRFTLNVLTNDSGSGQLTIVGTSVPNQGGVAEVALDGASILYSPRDGFAGREVLSYQVQDQQGALGQANVTVDVQPRIVAQDAQVGLRMETTTLSDQSISHVTEGETFLLSVFVRDLRPHGRGVAAAYVDVQFSGDLAAAGAVEHGSWFTEDVSGSVGEGVVNEVGGGSSSTSGVSELLLFKAPLVANSAGAVEFSIEAADLSEHFIRLYGQPNPLPRGSWLVEPIQLSVTPALPPPDPRDVNLDGVIAPLDALLVINDLNRFGARPVADIAKPWHTLDVNGDNYLAAIDALLIINYLNNNPTDTPLAARPLNASHDEIDVALDRWETPASWDDERVARVPTAMASLLVKSRNRSAIKPWSNQIHASELSAIPPSLPRFHTPSVGHRDDQFESNFGGKRCSIALSTFFKHNAFRW